MNKPPIQTTRKTSQIKITEYSSISTDSLTRASLREGRWFKSSLPDSPSAKPNDPGVLNRLDYALAQTGKFDEAIAYFNQAIRINPNYTTAKNNLNVVLADKQKLQNKGTENTKK